MPFAAGAMREARAGYYPATVAAERLRSLFLERATTAKPGDPSADCRTATAANAEWTGILSWAVAHAEAADLEAVRRGVEERLPDVHGWVTDDEDAGAGGGKSLPPLNLEQVHGVFRRWLGESYDLTALDAVLAAAAVEQLDGDPVWLLLVSGAGNAKTETVNALAGGGAHVTSAITSEGALLSATGRKDRSSNATGGLLRKIGDHGLLVIKDFTSILSMNRDVRAAVLAALREVYDGRWERNVGTDGGQTLTWTGRIAVVGAVTTAYDTAHGVIASMGDRFALVRVDSRLGRLSAGRQALRNVGHEEQMRSELAAAAGGVLAGLDATSAGLTEQDMAILLGLADLVTMARTAVERDYRGEVVEAHAPEAPTRFAKMLGQLVRGALALGASQERALAVALRVAGDSVPPQRLAVLADVMAHPSSTTTEVTKRVQRPRSTVDRTLQELHVLGLVAVETVEEGKGWHYRLADDVDTQVLERLVTRNVSTPGVGGKEDTKAHKVATDKSGDGGRPAVAAPAATPGHRRGSRLRSGKPLGEKCTVDGCRMPRAEYGRCTEHLATPPPPRPSDGVLVPISRCPDCGRPPAASARLDGWHRCGEGHIVPDAENPPTRSHGPASPSRAGGQAESQVRPLGEDAEAVG